MLISHEKKIIFIHNPKAMGTSITKSLGYYGNFTCLFKKHDKINKLGKIVQESDYKLYNIEYVEENDNLSVPNILISSYFKFGVVRNTYDWLVSIFLYNQARNNKAWKLFLSNSITKDFQAYLQFLKGISDDGIKIDDHENITTGQHSYFYSKDITVDFIINMENLNKDLQRFKDITSIDLSKVHVNKNDNKLNYRSYYNNNTKKMATTLFAKDIELFEFKF